jgi:hypothetical protein
MACCVSSGGPLPTRWPSVCSFKRARWLLEARTSSSHTALRLRWGCEQNGEVTKKITNIARFINSQKRKGQAAGKENQVSR